MTIRVISFIALILSVSVLSLNSLKAQVTHNTKIDREPFIEVTGHAEREVAADIAYISFSTEMKDKLENNSLRELHKSVQSVIKKNGLNSDEHLFINGMSSSYGYAFLQGKKVNNTLNYELKIDSLETINGIVHGLQKEGVEDIRLEESFYSEEAVLKEELKVEATENAMRTAEKMADATNSSLGSPIMINDTGNKFRSILIPTLSGNRQESGISYYRSPYNKSKDEKFTLSFDKLRYEANVRVRFRLLD